MISVAPAVVGVGVTKLYTLFSVSYLQYRPLPPVWQVGYMITGSFLCWPLPFYTNFSLQNSKAHKSRSSRNLTTTILRKILVLLSSVFHLSVISTSHLFGAAYFQRISWKLSWTGRSLTQFPTSFCYLLQSGHVFYWFNNKYKTLMLNHSLWSTATCFYFYGTFFKPLGAKSNYTPCARTYIDIKMHYGVNISIRFNWYLDNFYCDNILC